MRLQRRSFMAGLGTVGALALFEHPVFAGSRRAFFARHAQPMGLQLGSLGTISSRDIDAILGKVAEIGYREIELTNLFGLQPAQIGAAAVRAGLSVSSLHLPLMAIGGPSALSMTSDTSRIVDAMGALGAKWAVAPILLIPSNFRPQSGESLEAAIARTIAAAGEDIWKQTAEALNRKGDALRQSGIGVAYHNHNLDFAPIGKTTGWEILWRETEPDFVGFEVDIGWVQLAGLDPVHFLEGASGRIKLLHVRDIADSQPRGYRIAMGSPAVGSGKLDWTRILPAAYHAGARHFLVEQEPQTAVEPIDAVARSYTYLSQIAG
ncbi:sugar phosphate isomerase/epimerase [Novosphingobium sp. G106]|uniref:sugar phosphate isomerase/epimerase family protein n=1 Tax=Novosphingobium sp. G106 TaxID=2849500 RepID=UPI001C2CDEC7|nr:sugar phosphate isomerase/epimerase [Novosphingobium sp. G106]MBV1688409.1 sugar phosphate isomerase/epimerase [Novosphingobium sp. G106]